MLIHGRLDISGPLEREWTLSRAWPGSELIPVEDSGHTGSDTTRTHILSALDRFALAGR